MSVWDEVVGQEKAVAALQEAAVHARATLNGVETASRAMTHAWLVTGPPGSGRSTAARAFVAALQCTHPQVIGCGECDGCRHVMAKTHPDVTDFATEKSIISIEEVRAFMHNAQSAPSQGKWRVILLEDADRMQERTSNLLLKAIEEPPARTVWVLCAPSPEDLITTIRSRCRQVNLRIPPVKQVAQLLMRRHGVSYEDAYQAAALAQSHIGIASKLITDPEKLHDRYTQIESILDIDNIGDAVFYVEELLKENKENVEKDLATRNAREEAELKRTLGLNDTERIPPALRSQLTQLQEEQKRRVTRATKDPLDQLLVNLLSFFRDVMVIQTGMNHPPINQGYVNLLENVARGSTLADTYRKVTAIETARKRLQTNTSINLVFEALIADLIR
ncbi:putative DNA polymerase III, delta' subunit [Gleimia coleocanis DSM 15436]|uniref:DNA polymerase III subunit delta' n=1 Tax=Gleimia coleocanis DSM 15436 TaxID=525245 RepID=C0W271_9ACTO|nr:DNA polymerase III subunit delta' [Gleimia coleocanis]EEH63285.1 putative DNA polymerase III, delta' subunit [Gleimia coleocanis DSM 15436]